MITTVTLILIAAAAMFNAAMDKVETEIAFNTSIFRKLRKEFWCKPIAAHAIDFFPGTKFRVDFWHICKSAMIICVAAACSLTPFWDLPLNRLNTFLFIFLVFGVTWNLVFNAFYNAFFKTSEKK